METRLGRVMLVNVLAPNILLLTLSAPASLSVFKFFLHYPHKMCCLPVSSENKANDHTQQFI